MIIAARQFLKLKHAVEMLDLYYNFLINYYRFLCILFVLDKTYSWAFDIGLLHVFQFTNICNWWFIFDITIRILLSHLAACIEGSNRNSSSYRKHRQLDIYILSAAWQKNGPGAPGGQSWTAEWLKFDNSYFKVWQSERATYTIRKI
jgi:hypothetical protein